MVLNTKDTTLAETAPDVRVYSSVEGITNRVIHPRVAAVSGYNEGHRRALGVGDRSRKLSVERDQKLRPQN